MPTARLFFFVLIYPPPQTKPRNWPQTAHDNRCDGFVGFESVKMYIHRGGSSYFSGGPDQQPNDDHQYIKQRNNPTLMAWLSQVDLTSLSFPRPMVDALCIICWPLAPLLCHTRRLGGSFCERSKLPTSLWPLNWAHYWRVAYQIQVPGLSLVPSCSCRVPARSPF